MSNFRPGYLTAGHAATLNAAIVDAERTSRVLDGITEPVAKEFPARITAFDAATQRASWSEEAFDATGARYVKPGGRSGDSTFNPAFPVGNGLLPPPAFPFQVMLRERGIAVVSGTPIGMVYEFDYSCHCAGAGSGSGSGGTSTGVLTACCPSALPTTLSATFTVTSGTYATMDGQTVSIVWDGVRWIGSGGFGGVTWTVQLLCSGSSWSLTVTPNSGLCATAAGSTTLVACTPLMITSTGNGPIPGTCIAGAGATFDMAITE